MKIAVIGGGAAGMVSAWLLGAEHELVLLERAEILGGNVRTLGRNVACEQLPKGMYLDAGVIEFGRENFPRFHSLMDELGVELIDVPGTTSLNIDGRARLMSPANIRESKLGIVQRLLMHARLLAEAPAQRRFFERASQADVEELYASPLSAFLDDGRFGSWARLLAEYAYSIPYQRIDELPAALVVPTLMSFMRSNHWTAVKGGVYRYMERLLADERFTAHCSAHIRGIVRRDEGLFVTMESGDELRFDRVVFAAPPDQVLPLLTDADEQERRWFSAWSANHAETVVHSDTGIYERRGIQYFSEFDLFDTAKGERGYNAYLNRLCAVPDEHGKHYSLAYGLEGEIEPAAIVHRQPHHTPGYSVAALRHREEVKAANGYRGIWYAGAWLGDGLHEGAITSAYAVAEGINKAAT